MSNRGKVIVALDMDAPEQAVRMAQKIAPVFPFFKIGIKLFIKGGPALVKQVLKSGRVFLDLKFHDIPSVVADAVYQAAGMGVSLLSIHASGGSEMMRMSAERLRQTKSSMQLIGVTVLTSLSGLEEFEMQKSVSDHVVSLANLAYRSGLDGVVCSPSELQLLRPRMLAPFLMVTPGIRGPEDEKGDQKRTASAPEAIKAGADYLVIGRPIITSPEPVASAKKIAESIMNL